MERRKFVIGLGSLAAGGAAAMGSGAFSSVTADRETLIDIAGDQDAYLALQVEDAEHARITDDDIITVEFEGEENGGEGINKAATTRFNDVISIENQGTNDAYVWFVTDQADVTAGRDDRTRLYADNGDDLTEDPVLLETGESTNVDFEFETKGGTRIGRFEAPKRVRADVDYPSDDDDFTGDVRDGDDPYTGNPYDDS